MTLLAEALGNTQTGKAPDLGWFRLLCEYVDPPALADELRTDGAAEDVESLRDYMNDQIRGGQVGERRFPGDPGDGPGGDRGPG